MGDAPDLYAGEVAAAGRLLSRVSEELARHAVRSADLCAECRRAAQALEALADKPPFVGDESGRELVGLSAALLAAVGRCRGGQA